MSSAYTFIANLFDQLPALSPDTIISRTLFSDAQVKAVLFGFAAGQELSEHTASSPALLHLLRGEATLTLGSDSMAAREGTWAPLPAKLPHSVLARSPVVLML